jgi:hypothetical protein
MPTPRQGKQNAGDKLCLGLPFRTAGTDITLNVHADLLFDFQRDVAPADVLQAHILDRATQASRTPAGTGPSKRSLLVSGHPHSTGRY